MHPKLGLETLHLVGEYPTIPIKGVGDGSIVGPRVGWLDSFVELHQARGLFPNQNTKDAVHIAGAAWEDGGTGRAYGKALGAGSGCAGACVQVGLRVCVWGG